MGKVVMPALLSQSHKFMPSLALILSVLALLLVVAMRTTPCANAASGSCSVGDLELFTSAITVNEDGNDADTRMEGDTNANLLYLDAGNDAVIIGAAAPDATETLRVNGDLRIEGNLLVDTVAKGGILGGTAADTLGVLAVGANDEILVADSGESTGMKWAAPTAVQMATGTYTGDGTTSQEITGVGFQVVFLVIQARQTADAADAAPLFTSDTIIDDNASGGAVRFSSGEFRDNEIIALGADGFTVDDDGVDAHPNASGQIYNYTVWGQ